MRGAVFAWAVIALMGASGAAHALEGDWRRTVYWLAAATLNAAVTV
jgi:hypothetical protein